MKAATVVFGAGGLGSLLGALLFEAEADPVLVARGPHLDAIRASGLRVEGPGGRRTLTPRAVTDVHDLTAVEVAFVTTKSYDLESAGRALAPLARGGTTLVPLANGVDALDRLEAAGAPRDHLVAGVAYLTAFRTGPGSVSRHGSHGTVLLGAGHAQADQRARRVAELLAATGLETRLVADVRVELWVKMAVVCGLVAACALSRAELGTVLRHPLGSVLLERAVAEVVTVARALGVRLVRAHEDRIHGTLDGFPPAFHPSLIHDLENGVRTEIDALSGAVSRWGRQVGVPTPIADAVTLAVGIREG